MNWLQKRAKHRIFVYETLLHPQVIKEVLGREKKSHKTRLPGYKEVSVDLSEKEKDYHNIVEDDSSHVNGAIYVLTPEEMQKLDKWEDKYNRVEVQCEDGEAYTYVLK